MKETIKKLPSYGSSREGSTSSLPPKSDHDYHSYETSEELLLLRAQEKNTSKFSKFKLPVTVVEARGLEGEASVLFIGINGASNASKANSNHSD